MSALWKVAAQPGYQSGHLDELPSRGDQMERRILAKVSRHREVNIFGELSKANLVLLENATKQQPGHLYEEMACLVVAAFKHEAFINHLGFTVVPDWNRIERSSHHKKLQCLAKHLRITIDAKQRPFQTLEDLFAARNEIAHGKPSTLTQEGVVEEGTLEELRRKKPLTKWEFLCTLEFAKQVYDDTEEIATLLWARAGLDQAELRSRGHGYSIAEHRGKEPEES